MSSDTSAARQWTLVLVLTALLLSLVVLGQIIARYGAAYGAAPREMAALLDSADSSLQENESYERDVARLARREDKIRLSLLLREIQRAGDDLREDLNAVLAGGGGGLLPEEKHDMGASSSFSSSSSSSSSSNFSSSSSSSASASSTSSLPSSLSSPSLPAATFPPAFSLSASSFSASSPAPPEYTHLDLDRSTLRHRRQTSSSLTSAALSPRLKTSARILWAAKRARLEERLRRLDLLRMRFLVVYMSIVAASATAAAEKVEKTALAASVASSAASSPLRGSEKLAATVASPCADCHGSCRSPATPPPPFSSSSSSSRWPPARYFSPTAGAPDAEAGVDAALLLSSPSSPHAPTPTTPFRPNTLSPSLPDLPDGLLESIRRKPPLRRVSKQSPHHAQQPPPTPTNTSPEGHHRATWMGVVQELQRSPLLHKRHTSIETAVSRRQPGQTAAGRK